MSDRIEMELMALGMSPREAKVYSSTLRLGEAPASEIARRCGIPRLSTYSILERLEKMEWVTCYKKRKSRIYQVSSPESLLKRCDLEMSQIQSKREQFRLLIPRIQSFHPLGNGKEIFGLGKTRLIHDRFHFGQMCRQELKENKDWIAIQDGSLTDLLRLIDRKTNANLRCILPHAQREEMEGFQNKVEVRALPTHSWRIPANFIILGTKVIFIKDGQDFSALEIDQPLFTKTIKSFVEMIWSMDMFGVDA